MRHILVCGAPHSGTTLMLAVLDSHSRIAGIPKETGILHRKRRASDDEVLRLIGRWPEKYGLPEHMTYVAEKTPVHCKYLDRALRLLPDARILVMLRDGRDASSSAAERLGDFRLAVREWKAHNEAALAHAGHERVKFVYYEALVREPRETMAGVCEFLGIELEERMLEHDRAERRWYDSEVRPAVGQPVSGAQHKTHRNWQINQPLYDGSGKWDSVMTEQQKATFKNTAGRLLIQLGYAEDQWW